jgi:type VI secretion system protein ImpG
LSDPLLPYYQLELSFLRNEAAEFARKNRQIARNLGLGPQGASEDPHVARLMEAFAYLNARIRHKLDDDFPELTDSLLGVLYPHYQRPIPSLGIVEFVLDPTQGDLTTGYRLARGREMETLDTVDGERCRFRTCSAVTVWPIAVDDARLSGPPFVAPRRERPAAPQGAPSSPRGATSVESVLRLSLRTTSANLGFRQLAADRLRFYIDGQEQHAYAIHELLLNDCLEIALATSAEAPPVWLSSDAVRLVGFEEDEALLPYDARSLPAYRLLTEFFSFPRKFLFFDLVGLTAERLANVGDRLEIFFYLRRNSSDLMTNITRDTFRLGCTPIVNLFQQSADPISLTQTEYEYRVAPDRRRPRALEIYSIDSVRASSPNDEAVEYQPFYSFKHATDVERRQTFWHAARRAATGGAVDGNARPDSGTELFVSLVDLGFRPSSPADWTLHVETTCLNRDLPANLHQPRMQLLEGGPLSEIVCRAGPTPTLRPPLRHGAAWRLVSHLSLNHLSLVEQAEDAAALREILLLYDPHDSPATHNLIDGIRRVGYERSVARMPGWPGGVCRGTRVRVHLDEQRFLAGSAYLLSAVLAHYLGLYCSINSFAELVVTTQGREQRGEGALVAWKPRTGSRPLL